ncbi:MAG: hypothetical protein ACREJK_09480, partial [Candidatus Methylomirabilales bacterium]
REKELEDYRGWAPRPAWPRQKPCHSTDPPDCVTHVARPFSAALQLFRILALPAFVWVEV